MSATIEPAQSSVRLRLPLRFDESIGYWTGEADRELISRLLQAHPVPAGVTITPADRDTIILEGDAGEVQSYSSLLAAGGLQRLGPEVAEEA